MADGTTAVLMDLGLAQLADDIEGRLTRTRQFVGTLRYASPQQVLASGALDRRSDVYSLGATLWELLALRPLFGATDATPTPAVMEMIQRDEPERLRRLNPAVGRDLEAAVHKCLKKSPDRRYATAADLANDSGRWLNGEPVQARPVRGWERAWKWSKRRPVLSGLTAALAVVLTAGTISSWLLAAKAEREATAAKRRLRQARQAVDDYLIRVTDDDQLKHPRLEPLRLALLQDGLRHYHEFLDDGAGDLDLRAQSAAAYLRAGATQAELGDRNGAAASYEEALARFRDLAAELPSERVYQFGLTDSYRRLGDLFIDGHGSRGDAEEKLRRAAAVLTAMAEENSDDGEVNGRLARLYASQSRLAKPVNSEVALAYSHKAIDLLEQIVAHLPRDHQARKELADEYAALAVLQTQQLKLREAVASYDKAATQWRALALANPATAALADARQGKILQDTSVIHRMNNQTAEAAAVLERALPIRQAVLARFAADELFDLALTTNDLGLARIKQGDRTNGLNLLSQARDDREVLTRFDPVNPRYSFQLAVSHYSIGNFYAADVPPRNDAALESYRRGLAVLERLPEDRRSTAQSELQRAMILQKIGDVHTKQRDWPQAAAALETADAVFDHLLSAESGNWQYRAQKVQTLKLRGQVALATVDRLAPAGGLKERTQALDHLRRACDIAARLAQTFPGRADMLGLYGTCLSTLSDALERTGRPAAEAAEAMRQAAAVQKTAFTLSKGDSRYGIPLASSYRGLARLDRQLGRPDQAAASARDLRDLAPSDPEQLIAAASELAQCLPLLDPGERNRAERELLAGQAVEALRKAMEHGFKDADRLRRPDFLAIREYPEFKRLLTMLDNR
jgi:tetratricopeptide (TPR) repeat protein